MAEAVFSTQGLEVLYSSQPSGLDAELTRRLVEFIDATEESLDCAFYDLREPVLVAALRRVLDTGKRLRIVFGDGRVGAPAPPRGAHASTSDTAQVIAAAGIGQVSVSLHRSGRHLVHDKFLIRDGAAVWTGSANFTHCGPTPQDRNCLLFDSEELAAAYTAEFEALHRQVPSQAPPPAERTACGPSRRRHLLHPLAGRGH